MGDLTAGELAELLSLDDDLARALRRHVEVARAAKALQPDPRGPSLDEVELRTMGPEHRDEFVAAAQRSVAHLAGWGGPADTPEQFDEGLRRAEETGNVRFLVFHEDELVGGIGIQNIVRGHGQYATLGYYAFVPLAGRGIMRRGAAKAIDHAFEEMGLHRMEAGIMPHNVRSLALVQSLGFRYEGLLTRLVQIEGTWEDHELWATDVEDWPGACWFFPA